MFKVVAVSDKVGTAIDRLCRMVEPFHQNIEYIVCDVHPKRPSIEQLQRFEDAARTADVIDYQYFRTAEMLRAKYDWLKDIPSILTHNNPYSITESDWNSYQVVVGNNKSITADLHKITQSRVERIPLVVEPLFWKYNEEYKFERSVIMVANRIESKKGILPVAQACRNLGIKMYLVGAISQPEYWQEVMATGVVQFAQEVSDEELRDLYYKAGVHICNSVDNFESGTMPILEAMFCGIPVISRSVGHVPDIKDGDNIVINDHDPEDVEHLEQLIEDTLNEIAQGSKTSTGDYHYQAVSDTTRSAANNRRNQAWMSIKDRTPERRAYMYQKLYREIQPEEPVTVVLPIADNPHVTAANLSAIAKQTYPNIEVVVVDDGENNQWDLVYEFGKTVAMPVRYHSINELGYNLAKARNLAAIEATSDILVFCDQRMIMHPDAVEEFVKNLKPRYWLYGSKGAKKDFVENFSCIYREDFFTLGGFNERITMYGGMSQEVRSRARKQGMTLEYVESAKADPKGKSRNRYTKRYEIMEMKTMLWKMGMM